MTKTIVVRLGELSEPFVAHLAETGEKESDYVRRLIAADLGLEPPEMRGQVANLKQFAAPKKKRSRKPKPKT